MDRLPESRQGYGYGFVNLGYKATKTAHPELVISDGYVSGTDRTVNARYGTAT